MDFLDSILSFITANYKLIFNVLSVGIGLVIGLKILKWLEKNLLWRTDANAIWAQIVIVGAGVAFLMIVIVPKMQTSAVPEHMIKTRLQLENEARRTVAQIIAGIVVMAGVYLTWRRIVAMEKRIEVEQDGQVTDRYSKAIEQLGSDNLTVRLGGIYALERIARDSADDHWTIMEVLTAFLRERFRVQRNIGTGEFIEQRVVPTDLQAIIYVMRRLEWGARRLEHGRVIDLRETDLSSADLRFIALRFTILSDMNLHR